MISKEAKGDIKLLISIFVVVIAIIVFLQVGFVIADHIVATIGTSITYNFTMNESGVVEATLINLTINISGDDGGGNITHVNITVPLGFNVTAWWNGTGAAVNESGFSTTTTATGTVLMWKNQTIGADFLINETGKIGTRAFWFNVTADEPGLYNISITTLNVSTCTTQGPINNNQSNITIQVNDTTAPSSVTIVYPVTNANFSNISVERELINITLSATDNGDIQNVTFNITNTTDGKGVVYVGVNSTATYWNITVNTSLFTEGSYNITAWVNDTFGNLNKTVIANITIDRTRPYDINITTVNNSNLSGNFALNVTVLDALTGIGSLHINVTNGSGQRAFVGGVTISGNSITYIYNTLNVSDGPYNITFYVNDSAGNMNLSEDISVIIDNTDPSVTYSCTPNTAGILNTVTCTCSVTDALTGVNTSLTTYNATPSTANVGTFIVSCSATDMAGNLATTTTSYTVSSGDSSTSSGSSGGTTYSKTIIMSNKEFSEVETINQQLGLKERVRIKINGLTHYVGVTSVSTSKATVEITSVPVKVELDSGEEARVDVDNDGFSDVYVKLVAIVNGKADLIIKYIHEEISEETGVDTTGEVVVDDTTDDDTTTDDGEEMQLSWLWWVIIIIVVVVIAGIIYYFIKGRK
ncbi:MAG: Ig-like domain-containing protein [archaeon]